MIRDLHNKLINHEITSVQLTEQYFNNIEKKDKEIFAYLTVMKKTALEKAKKIDEKIKKGEEIGMLAGIPMAIKDNICIKGERTTSASKILDNYVAPYDASVVEKLEEEGAVVLGKTNLDEFAFGSSTENSAYGATKNPHDISRVPGGTSGGSAAAVAADLAVYALGSDTGGSIRQPASLCGAVGLKPTYGRVSRYGLMAAASSFDQIGTLSKNVEDAAMILGAITFKDPRDATSAPDFGKKYEDYLTGDIKGMKIGVIREYIDGLSEDMKKIMEGAIEKFQKLGAQIVDIKIPNLKYCLPAYYIIQPSEASSNLARYDGVKYGLRADDHVKSDLQSNHVASHIKSGAIDQMPSTLLETYLDTRRYGFGSETKRRIMLGTYSLSSGYYDAYYLKAQKTRALIKKDLADTFKTIDLIFSPTAPTPAFKFGEKTSNPLEMYLEDIFTITANIAGIPAISIPAGKVSMEGHELPVGCQLMAKWFDEENLLRAGDAFEKFTNVRI